MERKQKLVVAAIALVVAGGIVYFTFGRDYIRKQGTERILVERPEEEAAPVVENTGPVSPISGLPCDRWNGRPIAVMQPADPSARPAAGFSDADIVFEMPVFTNSNTRLMGVYLCTIPEDIGSMRSARHDYIPIAKALDAVFVYWGYSKFAESLLDQKIIDTINCLTTSYCPRWTQTGVMRYEDTGHITRANIEEAMADYGYRTTGEFSGYPHQGEATVDDRPAGGRLRVAYPGKYDVDYDYDRETNSYLRIWDDSVDTDKNNGKRIAPKNVVVMIAQSEQIKLNSDFTARGVQDPWQLVPEDERAGLDYGGVGRYNNVEMGDPWFDTQDGGDAFYYFNGRETKGTWKKDKSKLDSKLTFFDESGKEVRFVPGQIWVEVLEPGQGLKWTPQG